MGSEEYVFYWFVSDLFLKCVIYSLSAFHRKSWQIGKSLWMGLLYDGIACDSREWIQWPKKSLPVPMFLWEAGWLRHETECQEIRVPFSALSQTVFVILGTLLKCLHSSSIKCVVITKLPCSILCISIWSSSGQTVSLFIQHLPQWKPPHFGASRCYCNSNNNNKK